MSPFFSYSGRGRSHRGRGRTGRGAVGRGRGRAKRIPHDRPGIERTPYSGYRSSIDRRLNANMHKWVRSPESAKAKHEIKDNQQPESTLKNFPGTSSFAGADKIITGSNGNKETAEILIFPEYPRTIMKRNGQHQLILSSKTKARPVAFAGISVDSLSENEQPSRKPATQDQTLTREGRNKLISLAAYNTAKLTEQKQKQSMNSRSNDYKYDGFRGRQNNTSSISGSIDRRLKLAPHSVVFQPSAKRVKLSVQPSTKAKEEDTVASNTFRENFDFLSTSQAATGMDTNSKPKLAGKYSDFAYREVSRVEHRDVISGHNLYWSKKSNGKSSDSTYSGKTSLSSRTTNGNTNRGPKTKNMGLVRIQPDEKTTPICPTFLRGLHCQNQFCRKRHDIPKEYALPVCSFFQRHGQCLRGDSCIFRHVKLNAKALVCPSFAVLGFCEDEKCTMQHIHGQKGTNTLRTNGTCTIATEKSPSQFRRKSDNAYHRSKSMSGGRAEDT